MNAPSRADVELETRDRRQEVVVERCQQAFENDDLDGLLGDASGDLDE